jgi:hypothetical protein
MKTLEKIMPKTLSLYFMKPCPVVPRFLRLLALSLTLAPAFLAGVCYAENHPVVEATGSGQIDQGNVEQAREAAITNSLAHAVMQVAESLVPHPGITAFDQALFNNPRTHIQGYRVLDEWSTEDEYHVRVEATVATEAVKKRLTEAGAIPGRKKLPRILLMVSEKKSMDANPVYWWDGQARPLGPAMETIMARFMRSEGFSVTRNEDIPLPGAWLELQQTPDLSNDMAVQVGRYSSAQVVIAGSAKETASGKCVVSLRALRVDNGGQIGATHQTNAGIESNPSPDEKDVLYQLGALAAADLSRQLSAIWPTLVQAPTRIILVVHDTGDLAAFNRFQKSLAGIPDVTNAFLSELMPDQAKIQVEYQGDSHSLARSMNEIFHGGEGMNILDITSGTIEMRLAP